MKLFKKIMYAVLAMMLLSLLGGYFYFDQKFTPEENYLTVKNQSGKIPITWLGTVKNALLIPVTFSGDPTIYYMQFDTGAPYTVFYTAPIKHLKKITVNNKLAKTGFRIGNTTVSSDRFKIINNGDQNQDHSIKIIGTLGADMLENRKTILNFRENYIVFNVPETPIEFQDKRFDFKFKKRKIIIEAVLKGKEEKFLYDSGTSAYELLTTKEVWAGLKLPHSKTIVEKAQSWQNILTSYTANCNSAIRFNNIMLPLHEVTYVEGFSQMQYFLMKYSGMTGMLGNKIFLKNCIYIDCSENKMGIE